MTQPDTDQQPQTATTPPHRSRTVRYAAIAAAVLLVAGGIVLLITLLSGPAPIDYKVTATGAGNAMWITPDGSGQLDLTTGTGTQTVHASKVSVTVTSTAADGASCRITAPDGTVVNERQGASSVTCATP
jgi:hypothetical protein